MWITLVGDSFSAGVSTWSISSLEHEFLLHALLELSHRETRCYCSATTACGLFFILYALSSPNGSDLHSGAGVDACLSLAPTRDCCLSTHEGVACNHDRLPVFDAKQKTKSA